MESLEWRAFHTSVRSASGKGNLEPLNPIPLLLTSSLMCLYPCPQKTNCWQLITPYFILKPCGVRAMESALFPERLHYQFVQADKLAIYYSLVTSIKLVVHFCNGFFGNPLELGCVDVFSTHILKEHYNLLFWITKLYLELQIKISNFYLLFKNRHFTILR